MFDSDFARFVWKVCVEQHQYFMKTAKVENERTLTRENAVVRSNSVHSPAAAPGHRLSNESHPSMLHTGTFPRSHSHATDPNFTLKEAKQDHLYEPVQQAFVSPQTAPIIAPQIATIATIASPVSPVSPAHFSNEDVTYARTVSEQSSSGLKSITTVQVHHAPNWMASANTSSQDLKPSDERNLLLPVYQSAPDYETFLQEKYTVVPNGPVNYATPPQMRYSLSNFQEHLHAGRPISLPYYVQRQPVSHYKDCADLSSINMVGALPQIQPFNGHLPQPRVNGYDASHPFTNSSPDLHAHLSSIPQQMHNLTLYEQLAHNSVPDLTRRNQHINPELFNGNQLPMANMHNPVACTQRNDFPRRLPSGSEPNLPNIAIGNYYLPSSALRASRHLSIDALNQYKNCNISTPRLVSDHPIFSGRRLSDIESVRYQNVAVNCSKDATDSKMNGHVKTENHYANIDELRMSDPQVTVTNGSIDLQPVANGTNCTTNGISEPVVSTSEQPPKEEEVSVVQVENDYANMSNLSNLSNLSTISKDPRVTALDVKLSDSDQLMREFELLPRMNPQGKFTSALLPENSLRNRFRDILPYEDNRVHLPPSKDNRTGYVNASHIVLTIGQMQQRYIAAQGPLASTAADFWNMVWTNSVNLIVMVTELAEEGQEKCFPYFPNNSDAGKNCLQFDDFQVQCNFIIETSTYVTSSLTLNHHGTALTVWHIRYTDWPDHTCPEDIQGFLSFLEGIDAIYRLSGREGSNLTLTKKKKNFIKPAPGLLVHCSAGVGRSGAVILCDAMLKSLDQSKELDVPKALTQLRFQRMSSVQNFGQYKFVYRVLTQYLKNSRLI